jgi:hypothetical protein
MVEQWEIDLRQQLEGKINYKEEKEKMETKVNIENLSKKEYMNTFVMLFLLILLAFATVFIYNSKKIKEDNVGIKYPTKTNYDIQIASLRSDIEKVASDVVSSSNKLNGKIQANNDRLSVMGMLVTENFLIVRNNHDKNDLVFFNRDWTLDKMPKYLRLSDDDKEYLKKFTPNQ